MCIKNIATNQLQHRYPPQRPGLETQWISGGGGDCLQYQVFRVRCDLRGMTETHAHSFRETKTTDLPFSGNI